MMQPKLISCVVEGMVDEAVLRSLINYAGGLVGDIYIKNGKMKLLKALDGYNKAAHYSPWIVFVDLDNDALCAPTFRNSCLPEIAPQMCFRVVVREIEAWILADRIRVASFLGVPLTRIPRNPDSEQDPKRIIIDLARRSRLTKIREGIVPRPDSGREIGADYTALMRDFVFAETNGWRPDLAAENSDSLRRAMNCIQRLLSSVP